MHSSSILFPFLLILLTGKHVSSRSVTGLQKRRMGGQNPNFLQIKDCPGEICGRLGGSVPSALLAGAPPCAAQKVADEIIDAAKTKIKNPETQQQMIKWAQQIASAEKNTHPDYKKNPPTPRNALYCLEKPKNSELVGYYVSQDPANGPDEFFDPSTKGTVRIGEKAETKPPGPRSPPPL
ncbi:hypothetical protein BY996DRAFT_7123778 [Phakopsora pachyrhizi]|nr:hypothetical protein BY996DRAFT_7123778 [Phakopsora pachyrhizi]